MIFTGLQSLAPTTFSLLSQLTTLSVQPTKFKCHVLVSHVVVWLRCGVMWCGCIVVVVWLWCGVLWRCCGVVVVWLWCRSLSGNGIGVLAPTLFTALPLTSLCEHMLSFRTLTVSVSMSINIGLCSDVSFMLLTAIDPAVFQPIASSLTYLYITLIIRTLTATYIPTSTPREPHLCYCSFYSLIYTATALSDNHVVLIP